MEARIVEFASLLRQNGLRVSPAEVADAAAAVAGAGLEDRETFRSALAACLVKRGADHALFERLFALYFTGLGELLEGLERALEARLDEEGLFEGDELEMLLHELSGALSPLGRALVQGDAAALSRLLRGAALELDLAGLLTPLQAGFYARRMLAAAGAGAAERDLSAIERALAARGIDPARVERIAGRLAGRLRALEAAARRWVDREVEARLAERRRAGELADRPLALLSREETERMAVAVRRIALRLKARLARRDRRRRRGALHVRRTIRKNLGWGGVPATLAFRRKRPLRPDVVVLCDVSDSVRNVSRLMLLFVHTLQSLFARVRSFAFVSDLGEITEHVRDAEAAASVDLAIAGKAIRLYANSNYGRALSIFARSHLGAVTRRTTVLVIGDGRGNHHPPHVWALEEIRRRARRVIWICPEEERSWGLGDSEMLLYARAVDRVLVVRTLADFEQAADRIVPAPR